MADPTSERDWSLFKPMLAGASPGDRLLACIGAFVGTALTGLICGIAAQQAATLLLVAPIGASAVLLFAVPASPMAQPWPVIGGNTISAIVGVGIAHIGLPIAVAAGLAVAVAILAMSVLRCLHPPGGASALFAVIGGPAVAAAGWTFPLVPVAINSFALVLAGLAYHRFSGHSYPHRPVPVAGHTLHAPQPVPHIDDLDRALADLGETFDVTREDLEILFRQMEFYAAERIRGAA